MVKGTESQHKQPLANLLLTLGQEKASCRRTVPWGHTCQIQRPVQGSHSLFLVFNHKPCLTLPRTTAEPVGSVKQGQFLGFARLRMWPPSLWETITEHDLFCTCLSQDTHVSSLKKMEVWDSEVTAASELQWATQPLQVSEGHHSSPATSLQMCSRKGVAQPWPETVACPLGQLDMCPSYPVWATGLTVESTTWQAIRVGTCVCGHVVAHEGKRAAGPGFPLPAQFRWGLRKR